MIEIVPAILVKSKEELNERMREVEPYVKRVQIDIMDEYGGCHACRNHITQGIHLQTELTAGTEKSGDSSVKGIENAGQKDKEGSGGKMLLVGGRKFLNSTCSGVLLVGTAMSPVRISSGKKPLVHRSSIDKVSATGGPVSGG